LLLSKEKDGDYGSRDKSEKVTETSQSGNNLNTVKFAVRPVPREKNTSGAKHKNGRQSSPI
jgi:hypothetical protein